MNQTNKDGLYGALAEVLRAAKEPMDCQSLFEMDLVRQYANTVNRVSDYLGNMWRKGDVVRVPAPRMPNTRARWLYVWKGRVAAKPTIAQIKKGADFAHDSVQTLLSKPTMEITQEGKKVVITLPGMTITIAQH